MATETPKYGAQAEQEPPHSALAEFSRDERRPAVLLLSALLLSALFFGIGLMVGRWTAGPASTSGNASPQPSSSPASTPAASSPPATSPATNAASETSPNQTARRFSLLVATYDAPEKAQALIKALQEAGYAEIRTSTPRRGDPRPRYSVIVGRYTQDEAREAARQMRSASDSRLKNAKVVESSGQ
jgi:cell division septation protein DedD